MQDFLRLPLPSLPDRATRLEILRAEASELNFHQLCALIRGSSSLIRQEMREIGLNPAPAIPASNAQARARLNELLSLGHAPKKDMAFLVLNTGLTENSVLSLSREASRLRDAAPAESVNPPEPVLEVVAPSAPENEQEPPKTPEQEAEDAADLAALEAVAGEATIPWEQFEASMDSGLEIVTLGRGQAHPHLGVPVGSVLYVWSLNDARQSFFPDRESAAAYSRLRIGGALKDPIPFKVLVFLEEDRVRVISDQGARTDRYLSASAVQGKVREELVGRAESFFRGLDPADAALLREMIKSGAA